MDEVTDKSLVTDPDPPAVDHRSKPDLHFVPDLDRVGKDDDSRMNRHVFSNFGGRDSQEKRIEGSGKTGSKDLQALLQHPYHEFQSCH
jgi:hypothetical protein